MDELDELDQLINGDIEHLKLVAEKGKSRSEAKRDESRFVLDQNFNLVDGEGNIVKAHKPKSEFVVNQERKRKKKAKKLKAKVSKIKNQTFYDPSLPASSLGKRKRRKNPFGFYQKGELLQKAKRQRTKKLLDGHHKSVMEALGGGEGMSSGVMEMGDSQLITGLETIPVVEPWDESFLGAESSYETTEVSSFLEKEKDLEKKVNFDLVEHPVDIPPNYTMEGLAPLKVMLTKKEQRKLRKQLRMQKELEKQKKIRVGLLPKPAPKANLKNFMRVYLNDGTQMPTKLERQIRTEMEGRVREHEQRNLENKLSSKERREKKVSKNEEDMKEEVLTYVYKINSLDHPYHRFKINALAYKFVLTGVVLDMIPPETEVKTEEGDPDAADADAAAAAAAGGGGGGGGSGRKVVKMFIVEGGKKNLRRFDNKISRVEWNLTMEDNEKIDFESEEYKLVEPNRCKLMWKGTIKKKKFRTFKFHTFPSDEEYNNFLRQHSIDNFFNICRTWMDE